MDEKKKQRLNLLGELPLELFEDVLGYADEYHVYSQLSKQHHSNFRYILLQRRFMKGKV